MTDRTTAAPRDPLPRSARAWFDAPVAALVLLLSPAIGSVTTGIVIVLCVVGWFRLVPIMRTITVPRAVFWTSAAFVAFFLAEALAGAVNWHGLTTLAEVGANAVFLGMLPCYLLFARDRARLLDFMIMVAPWCALLVAAIAFVQAAYGVRPEGGAGNSAVFAVLVAILFAFNLVALSRAAGRFGTLVAIAGVLATAAALVLSETRSLWPCLVLFPPLIWFATRKAHAASLRPALIALAAILVIGIAFGGTIRERYDQAMADIAASQAGRMQTSLGKRFVIWEVAADAIAERPILGHGPDSAVPLMRERTPAIAGKPVVYSHFHNVLLDETVRTGIVGTLALIAMIVVPLGFGFASRRDATGSLGLALLMCFHAAYVLSGAAGIMLHHDLMDAQFVAMTAFCLYLLFPQTQTPDSVAMSGHETVAPGGKG